MEIRPREHGRTYRLQLLDKMKKEEIYLFRKQFEELTLPYQQELLKQLKKDYLVVLLPRHPNKTYILKKYKEIQEAGLGKDIPDTSSD